MSNAKTLSERFVAARWESGVLPPCSPKHLDALANNIIDAAEDFACYPGADKGNTVRGAVQLLHHALQRLENDQARAARNTRAVA